MSPQPRNRAREMWIRIGPPDRSPHRMQTMKSRQFAIAAVAAGLMAFATAPSQAADPFAAFSGNWSGTGTIVAKDGGRERIRCRGSNADSGNTLKLGLRCASDSYKFELSSDITYDRGAISGNWGEASRGVYGTLSGRLNDGQLQA